MSLGRQAYTIPTKANSDVAQHFNTGFEAQLLQMSIVNYDFIIHPPMSVYKEAVEARIERKEPVESMLLLVIQVVHTTVLSTDSH